jgi:lysyl-tRNA synthetase class 2
VTNKDLKKFEGLEKGKKAENDLVTFTGRIISKRESSAKLVFYDIVQNGETMQVVASRGRYNGSPDEFAEKNHELCRGDIACKLNRIVVSYF